VKDFLHSQGTIYTTSTPYTPQHNALIERKNRTVVEMTKSMMYHANAYIRLYGEAAVASVYILNRTINTHTGTKTPNELWDNQKPNTSHLHVWGCDVHYHNHKEKRTNKLDMNSKPGIFVGYDTNNDVYYRIYDVDNGKIIISRDVIFHDDRFNEMKRLNERMKDLLNNENNNDDHDNSYTKININDYLPDSLFRSKNAIADMFGDGGTVNLDNDKITKQITKQIMSTRVAIMTQ
jgi:hypothetical protein